MGQVLGGAKIALHTGVERIHRNTRRVEDRLFDQITVLHKRVVEPLRVVGHTHHGRGDLPQRPLQVRKRSRTTEVAVADADTVSSGFGDVQHLEVVQLERRLRRREDRLGEAADAKLSEHLGHEGTAAEVAIDVLRVEARALTDVGPGLVGRFGPEHVPDCCRRHPCLIAHRHHSLEGIVP